MEKYDIERVKSAHKLSDFVRPLTKLSKASQNLVGLCPFHKERTPSFYVSDRHGRYKCFGCGAWGDLIDFLMLTRGIGFQETLEQLQGSSLAAISTTWQSVDRTEKEAVQDDEKRRMAHAHNIWLKREPIKGTLAERYLRETRAIKGHLSDNLGFIPNVYCSPIRDESPALIAPLQDSNGHVTAIQQIFLCSETLDAWRDDNGRRIKRTVGLMRDGCVRLGLPDAALGIAGSVEDSLAASMLFSLPVWATCGEHRYRDAWIPDEVEDLIIFADNDDAGMKAAEAAFLKHSRKNRVVNICPPISQKDWTAIAEERDSHEQYRARTLAG